MIIFDLDGTLANCEHRRHFVDPKKNAQYKRRWDATQEECVNNKVIPEEYILISEDRKSVIENRHTKFKPDWKSFYEACDKDEPIEEAVDLLHRLFACELDIHIWSGRCESVREKTEEWLLDNVEMKYCVRFNPINNLKMRPEGDSTPDDVLKEKWLDEALSAGNNIDFVFDSDKKSIAMWRKRGVFVFNCCQHDMSFYAN